MRRDDGDPVAAWAQDGTVRCEGANAAAHDALGQLERAIAPATYDPQTDSANLLLLMSTHSWWAQRWNPV